MLSRGAKNLFAVSLLPGYLLLSFYRNFSTGQCLLYAETMV